MNLKQAKKAMLQFRDFYGQDIPQTDEIKNAKTKKELGEILWSYHTFLEMQNQDALSHLEQFKRTLKIPY